VCGYEQGHYRNARLAHSSALFASCRKVTHTHSRDMHACTRASASTC
jgi:hypothetical protein